jgi:CRP-like cAMP-binding protein
VDFPPGEVFLREGEKRGELFGEISALLGIECTTTVRTREKSTLLMIEDAEEFLENHPRTTMFIAKMLAARLTDATNIQALLQREHRELKMESERPKPM